MSDSTKGLENRSSGQSTKTYEEARLLLECRDIENLIELASDDTCFPEMLYFLSSDRDSEIRTKVAANPSTPIQADELLSKDAEPSVREAVGAKIAHNISSLSSNQDAARIAAIAILEDLIEDEEVRVRRIIAEELKITDRIPIHIIQKLARDIDEFVSSPILRHSPILDDEELIQIIKQSATTSQL